MPTCDSTLASLRTAYILAGGRSTRFGSSKAMAEVDGRPQIQRLADQLRQDAWNPVAVSRRASEFDALGIQTVVDFEADRGPVAGVLSGLLDHCTLGQATSPWALFLSCDLWSWNPEWSGLLVPGVDDLPSVSGVLRYFRAVDFLPLPCVIHRRALPQIQIAWDRGIRSFRELISSLGQGGVWVPIEPHRVPVSFNTPEDLRGLRGS
ncbi:MAG: molybdenum cofactor guanylyltransferase [Planctomycetes bacterium]|nr:molybdenum cofactor guanylyltransferase [Planctomycetota bacterium]